MNNRTFNALMARGFRSLIARELVRQGRTLSSLQRLPATDLSELGLTESETAAVKSGRPPIPTETCHAIFYDAAWTCCVCQVREREVILHHIVPWSESRSHDKDNLVLICIECHGRAHTVHSLSANLTPEKLRDARDRWYSDVRHNRTNIALGKTSELHVSSMWDYFNHRRVLEYATGVGVDVQHELATRGLLEAELTDEDGLPVSLRNDDKAREHRFMYDRIGGLRRGQMPVYQFYSHLIRKILERSSFAELTYDWSRQRILSLVRPGTIVLCKGAHSFRRHHASELDGPGQRRTVTRKKDGIALTFSIDAWECTSSSANWDALSGRSVVTSVSWIRDLHTEGGALQLSAKALSIGTGLGPPHPTPSAPEVLEQLGEALEDEPDADEGF